jgi:dihydrofolate synthase/folylpolyglutamate synthase
MLNTKDSAGFLAPLAPVVASLQAVTIPDEENPLPASALVASARAIGIAGQEAPSIAAALRAIAASGERGRVLICGSLHFAGVVLRDNG